MAALVAFATWMFLASPCLVVERRGLRIVNPLRVHWIPFAVLEDVHVHGLTTVTLLDTSGRTRQITSWNAPGVPRRFEAVTPQSVTVIDSFRARWEARRHDDDEQPLATSTSWRRQSLMILAALALLTITIWSR